jgi:hypothetical protein
MSNEICFTFLKYLSGQYCGFIYIHTKHRIFTIVLHCTYTTTLIRPYLLCIFLASEYVNYIKTINNENHDYHFFRFYDFVGGNYQATVDEIECFITLVYNQVRY